MLLRMLHTFGRFYSDIQQNSCTNNFQTAFQLLYAINLTVYLQNEKKTHTHTTRTTIGWYEKPFQEKSSLLSTYKKINLFSHTNSHKSKHQKYKPNKLNHFVADKILYVPFPWASAELGARICIPESSSYQIMALKRAMWFTTLNLQIPKFR